MEILFWFIGIIIVVGLAKLFGKSFRFILKLLANSLSGLLLLLIFNLVAGFFGSKIDINFVHALVAGTFGVPGLILLLVIQLL